MGLVIDSSGEVEASHEDVFFTAERGRRRYAEAARGDTIGALGGSKRADSFLLQSVDRAAIIAARRIQPPLTLENYSEIGRQLAAGRALRRSLNAKHHAHAAASRAQRPGKT